MPRELRDIAQTYDRIHARRPERPATDDPWHDWTKRAVDRSTDLDGRRVLEAGCGRGGFSHWIAAHATPALFVASDFSTAALHIARDTNPGPGGPVGWPAADVAHLPFTNDAFDTVFCCETIEHVLDPPAVVRELARVLAPGGRLFLTTPSYLNATGLYRGYLRLVGRRYDEGGQPVAQFTMLPLTLAWVRRAGLVVERVDGSGHYLPFPGRAPMRALALDAPALRPLLKWAALHSSIVARKPVTAARP